MDEKVRKVTANITGRHKGVPNPILDKICRRTPAGTIGYECELLSHISSLEEQLNNLQSHANRIGEVIDYIIKLEDRIQSLEEGIEELIAYGMPKHIELGLKELIEKK